MRLGGRMGGHIVTGHIDCIGKLTRSSETSGNRVLEFSLPAENARYLISKGSVAINGISLTVNTVTATGFSVNIIPLTQSATTLSGLMVGDEVNIETDIIGKYVERLARPWSSANGLSMKSLAENGFL
jgi:riboflavin synthase